MKDSTQPRGHTIVFVLGPPGSGKGTLCKLATVNPEIPTLRILHLSMGDYLRELSRSESLCRANGFDCDRIRYHTEENILLPSEVLIPILQYKINSVPDEEGVTTTWLIDGFPRNIETALTFEEKICKPAVVIVLDCERDVARGRFLSRGREKKDDKERFERRYNEYIENMKAIREHYGSLVETVYVHGSIEDGFKGLKSLLPHRKNQPTTQE